MLRQFSPTTGNDKHPMVFFCRKINILLVCHKNAFLSFHSFCSIYDIDLGLKVSILCLGSIVEICTAEILRSLSGYFFRLSSGLNESRLSKSLTFSNW